MLYSQSWVLKKWLCIKINPKLSRIKEEHMYNSVTWDQTLDPKGSCKAQMNNFVQHNYLDCS